MGEILNPHSLLSEERKPESDEDMQDQPELTGWAECPLLSRQQSLFSPASWVKDPNTQFVETGLKNLSK